MSAADGFHKHRRIVLFIAGGGPNSQVALDNLEKLKASEPSYTFEIEIIDVLDDFKAAQERGVLVTPCLLLLDPPPRTMIVGTLKDVEKVRTALRIERGATPS